MQGPQDPHQLLSALSPLLTRNGGIKGPEEAVRISSLMKDSVKKVGKCIYINILKATESEDALSKVLDCDGWATLNAWLQESKEEDNLPLLIELLKLYQNLPVTIEILKKNNAAKVIKQLSKSEDEKVKTLSTRIVDSWMKKIRGRSSNTENENDKVKKKKKDKHKDSKEANKDSSKEKKEKSHHHHHSNKDSSDKDSSHSNQSGEQSDRLGHNHKTDSKSDKDSNKDDAKKRPKTVKTFAGKFRSTGIGEDKAVAPVKKKPQEPNKIPLLKRSVQDSKTEDLPEKKPRLTLNMPQLTSASLVGNSSSRGTISPTEIHGKIKIIPPKKPPGFHESSGFMDSLITKPSYAVKRKKKLSPGKNATPTSPTSPTTSNTSPTAQVPPSPTTAMAHKLPSVPSFYKDTLDTSEEQADARSPSPEERMDAEDTEVKSTEEEKVETEDGTEDQDVEMKNIPEELEESNAEPVEDLPEYSTQEPKSVLTTGSTKRKKGRKNVSWADDTRLREYFYFELDETERENVNRPKDSFNLLKKQEMMMDRRAMESAKRMINDNMVEAIPWRHPPPFDDASTFVHGANSIEKDIQKAREQKVLQAIFFNKTMLPDTPSEPDLESIEPSQPKIIPLEDENAGEELTYTYENIYPQTTVEPPIVDQYNLPPELANVIATLGQQQQDPASQQATNAALANIQNIIASYLSGADGKTGELSENLRRALEPFKQQLPPEFSVGFLPDLPPGALGPPGPMHPGMRPGLLGSAPPGFPPMGAPPMGPRFPGPGPGMGGPGEGDEWGENMMGGPHGPPPHGPPHGPPPHGPPMRGRGGPFIRGGPPRGPPPRMMRGGRGGRGGQRGKPVCRHFVQPGGCRFGNTCNFLHPGVNGPPNP